MNASSRTVAHLAAWATFALAACTTSYTQIGPHEYRIQGDSRDATTERADELCPYGAVLTGADETHTPVVVHWQEWDDDERKNIEGPVMLRGETSSYEVVAACMPESSAECVVNPSLAYNLKRCRRDLSGLSPCFDATYLVERDLLEAQRDPNSRRLLPDRCFRLPTPEEAVIERRDRTHVPWWKPRKH